MEAENPFLETSTAAAREAQRLVVQLARLAELLPSASQADDGSHYAKAPGLSREATQQALLRRTGYVCVMARLLGWGGAPLTSELILQMHHGIFVPDFGDAALGYRAPLARGEHRLDDAVVYPIWVVGARSPEPTVVPHRGAVAKQVGRRVRELCAAFEADAARWSGDSSEAATMIARLYVRIIRVHPFGDGNGRTAWAALQFAAGRLRYPWIKSSPTLEARLALGDAIRSGNRIGPLAEHIRAAAWDR